MFGRRKDRASNRESTIEPYPGVLFPVRRLNPTSEVKRDADALIRGYS